MKPLIPILLALAIASASPAKNKASTETERNEKAKENDLDSWPIAKGLTLPNCMKLQWKDQDKRKLPISVIVTNPFVDEIEVPVTPSSWTFDIEYYDPYLALCVCR